MAMSIPCERAPDPQPSRIDRIVAITDSGRLLQHLVDAMGKVWGERGPGRGSTRQLLLHIRAWRAKKAGGRPNRTASATDRLAAEAQGLLCATTAEALNALYAEVLPDKEAQPAKAWPDTRSGAPAARLVSDLPVVAPGVVVRWEAGGQGGFDVVLNAEAERVLFTEAELRVCCETHRVIPVMAIMGSATGRAWWTCTSRGGRLWGWAAWMHGSYRWREPRSPVTSPAGLTRSTGSLTPTSSASEAPHSAVSSTALRPAAL